MRKLRFGVLGCAKIAREKVIPGMRGCAHAEVSAIASRDPAKARATAAALGIAKAHGSYAALLADPDIDVVYNPLPNHEHVPWTIRAALAGKHVLCEKPIDLSADGARRLIEVRDRTAVRIQEAFMVRTHPQWLKAREIVQSGALGELVAITGHFSYHLTDPANVRNVADWGGGGLLDIGCYPITTSRFVTGREPSRVQALIERDPVLRINRKGSVTLDFDGLPSSFTYGTQMVPRQTAQFFATKARLEVEIPFDAPNDRPCRLFLDHGALRHEEREVLEIPVCDQYGIMADAFASAILHGHPQPIPLEDTLANMRVIDAVFRSAATGDWQTP